MSALLKYGPIDPDGKCTAHLRDGSGKRCRKRAMLGQRVCASHGGAAPAAKRNAKKRLEEAADKLAKELLHMALDPRDESIPAGVRLNAILAALDRAGLGVKSEVEVAVKPYEQVMESVMTGSRAESRRARGLPPGEGGGQADEGISIVDGEVIDAEVVEPDENDGTPSPACSGCGRTFPAELPPGLDAYPELCRDCRQEQPEPELGPSPSFRPGYSPPPTRDQLNEQWELDVAEVARANRQAGVLPPVASLAARRAASLAARRAARGSEYGGPDPQPTL